MIHPNTNIKNVALFDTPKLRESNKIITLLFEAKLLNKFFAKKLKHPLTVLYHYVMRRIQNDYYNFILY